MSRFPDKRLRFTVEQDMQLLLEIIRLNPFEDGDRWLEVHENFVNACNVPFSLRTCKDHASHLLNLHLKDAIKIRPRETPKEFEQKRKYLNQILELRSQCGGEVLKRGPQSSNSWEDTSNHLLMKDESQFIKFEDSDDDFYWEEENKRDKKEKERDAIDADGKLRKQELALEERKLFLKEKQLKLEQDRLELDKFERAKRLEMEKSEREAYENVALQNHTIITTLMDKCNRRSIGNNLCIL
ncbi:hypothetical protein ABEB36_003131 [Hypothenemus hampei]|uniref:Uncharacterized protein n=1 Tax=Hypothenemus hampei TaxID=57062 RepID=A0ABD1F8I6_HYPHA